MESTMTNTNGARASYYFDADQVKRAAEGRGGQLVLSLTSIDPQICDGAEHPCPKCGGRRGFKVYVAGGINHFEQRGAMKCYKCDDGQCNDWIESVRWLNGWSYPQVINAAGEQLGLTLSQIRNEGSKQTSAISKPGDLPSVENGNPDFARWMLREKSVPLDSAIAFGARADTWTTKSNKQYVTVSFPMFQSWNRSECSRQHLGNGFPALAKGLSESGKPVGLFHAFSERPKDSEPLLIVEGCKDAPALHSLGHQVVGLPGCNGLSQRLIKDGLFDGLDIILVPDRDAAGINSFRKHASNLIEVAKRVRICHLPIEMKDKGGADVRDVLKLENGEAKLRQALAEAEEFTAEDAESLPVKPEILVSLDEQYTNDEVILALADRGDLYSHNEQLSTVDAGKIYHLPAVTLRELISTTVSLYSIKETDEGDVKVYQRIPRWCYEQIHARHSWVGIPEITGVTNCPVMRPDGSILDENGFDPQTGLFAVLPDDQPKVAENLTQEDAKEAADELLETVCDFPFATREHQAAFVAALLTPLAREAYQGSTGPLFLFDANTRGAGKSLLADLISLIVTGTEATRFTAPINDEEARKRITALVEAADRIVLIDNIAGRFGSPSLDAALTGTVWKDRRLGHTALVEAPLRMTWLASGNNVILGADTARRVCHIRLESPLEHPEDRQGFRYPNIRQHVTEKRSRLIAAALTILRAYVVAGRPDMKLKPWGSFEGWSGLVRNAIVFAGLADPGETRDELRETADSEAVSLRAMIEAMQAIDPECTGLSASDLIAIGRRQRGDDFTPEQCEELAIAIEELCGRPIEKVGARNVGNALSHFRGRVIDCSTVDYSINQGRRLWYTRTPKLHDSGGLSGSGATESPEPHMKNQGLHGNTHIGTGQTRGTGGTKDTTEHAITGELDWITL